MNIAPIHRCHRTDSGIYTGIACEPRPARIEGDEPLIQSALLRREDDADERMFRRVEWLIYAATFLLTVVASAMWPGVWFS